MLVFVEGEKPEYPEKNPRSRDENQQQTQPTYGTETGNRNRATLVGGECSHHCAIPAPYASYILWVIFSQRCFTYIRSATTQPDSDQIDSFLKGNRGIELLTFILRESP